jgi:hypothetical protein
LIVTNHREHATFIRMTSMRRILLSPAIMTLVSSFRGIRSAGVTRCCRRAHG